jgi:hypothetical protein
MRAEELAARVGAKLKGREYVVCCPAHPDKDPSLNFRNGKDAIIIRCRSRGCSAEDILKAWGLTFADVVFNVNGHGHASSGGQVVATYDGAAVYPRGVRAAQPSLRRRNRRTKLTATRPLPSRTSDAGSGMAVADADASGSLSTSVPTASLRVPVASSSDCSK